MAARGDVALPSAGGEAARRVALRRIITAYQHLAG